MRHWDKSPMDQFESHAHLGAHFEVQEKMEAQFSILRIIYPSSISLDLSTVPFRVVWKPTQGFPCFLVDWESAGVQQCARRPASGGSEGQPGRPSEPQEKPNRRPPQSRHTYSGSTFNPAITLLSIDRTRCNFF